MSEHARKRARAVLRGRDSGNIILLLDNLTGTRLIRANLRGANLSGADLSEAHLFEAHLSGATVTVEQLVEAKSFTGATMPDGSKRPYSGVLKDRATLSSSFRE